ncbi:NUDIX hydrolase [Dactylosporangium sp. CA-139066]|uniref:NUDIX hydrolase n=1 Tax=Dactylosporangium sp. CA-139066 TaxID=3239930 RepID=UPI003D90767B
MTNWTAKMRDAELIESEVILETPKRWVREQLRMPDGAIIDWFYTDNPSSVVVVPITADGGVVLVRQYRHNLKRDTLELPAGIVSKGEDLDKAALRELVEETGYDLADAGHLHPLGAFYARPSETAGYSHLYLASPVFKSGAAQLDTEIEQYFDMSVVTMPLGEAIAEIGRSINGLETLGALLLAQRQLATLR